MIQKAIRHIITIGAALGFLHGGWESCDAVFARIGPAATVHEATDLVEVPDPCPTELEKVRDANALPNQSATDTPCPSKEGNTPQLSTSNVTGGQRGVPSGDGSRAAKAQSDADSNAAKRIANEQEELNRRVGGRIAREQEELNRRVGERIARQQEALNRREVERVVRQQTELNRRESARFAAEQEARDRREVERIKREEALKNRSALGAIAGGTSPTAGGGAPPANARFAHEGAIPPSLRARQIERIERALRKTASLLDRAHLPR